MPDQTITCSDCQQTFEFSEGEQEFYESKGLLPPKRCVPCRQAKKAKMAQRSAPRNQSMDAGIPDDQY